MKAVRRVPRRHVSRGTEVHRGNFSTERVNGTIDKQSVLVPSRAVPADAQPSRCSSSDQVAWEVALRHGQSS